MRRGGNRGIARRARWLASLRPATLGDALAIVASLEAARPHLSAAQWRRARWAAEGVLEQGRARSTGTLVSIVPASLYESDPDVGRYALICEDHGGIVIADAITNARGWKPRPEGWCPTCQENRED